MPTMRDEVKVQLDVASDTLVRLGNVVPVTSTVWADLMNVIARVYAVLYEQPVTLFNDLILNQRLLELKACVRDAEQKITDLTPSREVGNATDTPTTHA